MTEYLQEYLASEESLKEQETALKQAVEQRLHSPNRLRTYMQLLMIARVACEALEGIDQNAFLTSIKDEAEQAKGRSNQLLGDRAQLARQQVDELASSIGELQNELKQRGLCIDRIMQGLGELASSNEELEQLKASAHNTMQEMEQRLQALAQMRQQQDFVEVCRLARQRSTGNNG